MPNLALTDRQAQVVKCVLSNVVDTDADFPEVGQVLDLMPEVEYFGVLRLADQNGTRASMLGLRVENDETGGIDPESIIFLLDSMFNG